MEPGSYSLAAFRASGGSEVEDIAFMIVPAASADLEGLDGAEEDADRGMSCAHRTPPPGQQQ